MTNGLLEGEVALLCASQKMKEEMDRAWKDFFDRNVPPRGHNMNEISSSGSSVVPAPS